MPILEATTSLYNPVEYGRVEPGDRFKCSETTAKQLERRGRARRVVEQVMPDPYLSEVVALPAEPFRVMHLPDKKPPTVAPDSNRVFHVADVSTAGVVDRQQRKRRKSSDTE